MAAAPPPFSPSPTSLSAFASDISRAVDDYGASPSHAGLQNILSTTRALTLAATSPFEFFASFKFSPLAYAALRVAISMNLIPQLPSNPDESIALADLAAHCNATEDFTLRIARALVVSDILAMPQPLHYAHTPFSRLYLSEQLQCSASEVFTAQKTRRMRLSFTGLGERDMDFWEWLEKHPQRLRNFQKGMGLETVTGSREVADTFPWAALSTDAEEDAVMVVDVGGGRGQLLKEIGKVREGLKGKLILQDLSHVIENGTVFDEGEATLMAYNFLKQEQPVKGAKAYFMRWIFHDWPDEACKTILNNLKPAMRGYDSRLLICDRVLDDSNPRKLDALCDMNMMNIAGKERSIMQWEQLLGSENFVIQKIYGLDNPVRICCIIEARLKEN